MREYQVVHATEWAQKAARLATSVDARKVRDGCDGMPLSEVRAVDLPQHKAPVPAQLAITNEAKQVQENASRGMFSYAGVFHQKNHGEQGSGFGCFGIAWVVPEVRTPT